MTAQTLQENAREKVRRLFGTCFCPGYEEKTQFYLRSQMIGGVYTPKELNLLATNFWEAREILKALIVDCIKGTSIPEHLHEIALRVQKKNLPDKGGRRGLQNLYRNYVYTMAYLDLLDCKHTEKNVSVDFKIDIKRSLCGVLAEIRGEEENEFDEDTIRSSIRSIVKDRDKVELINKFRIQLMQMRQTSSDRTWNNQFHFYFFTFLICHVAGIPHQGLKNRQCVL